MGKNAKLPVMQLELNTGVFRIKTEEEGRKKGYSHMGNR